MNAINRHPRINPLQGKTEMIDPELATEIAQEHEPFLNELEGLAIEAICASQQRFAIATNDWSQFYAHVVDFQNEHDLHGESGFANIDDTDGDAFTDANLISNNQCTLAQTTTEAVEDENLTNSF
jgi:hypothetical protein